MLPASAIPPEIVIFAKCNANIEKKPMEPQRKALEKGPETGRKAKKTYRAD